MTQTPSFKSLNCTLNEQKRDGIKNWTSAQNTGNQHALYLYDCLSYRNSNVKRKNRAFVKREARFLVTREGGPCLAIGIPTKTWLGKMTGKDVWRCSVVRFFPKDPFSQVLFQDFQINPFFPTKMQFSDNFLGCIFADRIFRAHFSDARFGVQFV